MRVFAMLAMTAILAMLTATSMIACSTSGGGSAQSPVVEIPAPPNAVSVDQVVSSNPRPVPSSDTIFASTAASKSARVPATPTAVVITALVPTAGVDLGVQTENFPLRIPSDSFVEDVSEITLGRKGRRVIVQMALRSPKTPEEIKAFFSRELARRGLAPRPQPLCPGGSPRVRLLPGVRGHPPRPLVREPPPKRRSRVA